MAGRGTGDVAAVGRMTAATIMILSVIGANAAILRLARRG